MTANSMTMGLHVSGKSQSKWFSSAHPRGGSRISGNGVHMYKGVGFALLILSNFSQISHENEIIWSHNFIFLGYLKTGDWEGFKRTPCA